MGTVLASQVCDPRFIELDRLIALDPRPTRRERLDATAARMRARYGPEARRRARAAARARAFTAGITTTAGTIPTREVMRATGATQRQLWWWDANGIVCPEHRGLNRACWYSEEQVRAIRAILALRRAGIGVRRAVPIVREMAGIWEVH